MLDRRTTVLIMTIIFTFCVLTGITIYFYRKRVKGQVNAILQSYYDSAILSFEQFIIGKQVSVQLIQAVNEAARLRLENNDSLFIIQEIQKQFNVIIPDQVIEKAFFSKNIAFLNAENEQMLKAHVPTEEIELKLREKYQLHYVLPLRLFMSQLISKHNNFDLKKHTKEIIEKVKSSRSIQDVYEHIRSNLNVEMSNTDLYNVINQLVYEDAFHEAEKIVELIEDGQSISEALRNLNSEYIQYGFDVHIQRSDVDPLYKIEVERKEQAISDFENVVIQLEKELQEFRLGSTSEQKYEENSTAFKEMRQTISMLNERVAELEKEKKHK